jgi:hypothetical protein
MTPRLIIQRFRSNHINSVFLAKQVKLYIFEVLTLFCSWYFFLSKTINTVSDTYIDKFQISKILRCFASTLSSFLFGTTENNFHSFINIGQESLENLQFFLDFFISCYSIAQNWGPQQEAIRPNRFTLRNHRKLNPKFQKTIPLKGDISQYRQEALLFS